MKAIARRNLMTGGAALAVAAATVPFAAKAHPGNDAKLLRIANACLAEMPEYLRLRKIAKDLYPVYDKERDQIPYWRVSAWSPYQHPSTKRFFVKACEEKSGDQRTIYLRAKTVDGANKQKAALGRSFVADRNRLDDEAMKRSGYSGACDVWGDALDEVEKKLRAMTKIPATTIEGVRAKASVAKSLIDGIGDAARNDDFMSCFDDFEASVLKDAAQAGLA